LQAIRSLKQRRQLPSQRHRCGRQFRLCLKVVSQRVSKAKKAGAADGYM
jgi:hypothetical protein